MEAVKELIQRELNESPSSLALSFCFLLVELVSKAAQTHVKLGPFHISSIMKSVISWFPLDNGSQSHSLHQACAKLVCSLAGNAEINADCIGTSCMTKKVNTTECNDSTCPYNSSTSECNGSTCTSSSGFQTCSHEQPFALVVDCLCRPLLRALCSRIEPVSLGATTCLDALVSMETWSFESPHLVQELCLRASNAMQERTALSANTAQLSLLCNLAKTNPESLSPFKAGLLKKGSDILLNNGAWQQRVAAVRLMESLLSMGASSVEKKHDKKAVMYATETLESCRLDKVTMVRSVVGEALKAAKQQGILHNPELSLIDDESSSGHTKAARPGGFCMQASKTDYKKRRRKKPLGFHEKQPALTFPYTSDHFSNHTTPSLTWSSSDSVSSSVDFECPKSKVARVGCNGRTSSSANGVTGTKTIRQSGAKKFVTSPASSSSLSSSSSSSSSSSLSSSSSSLPSSLSSSLSSSATPTSNGCPSEKFTRIGCNGRQASSSCECTGSVPKEIGFTQDLTLPTSSSASSLLKPTIDETRMRDHRRLSPSCTTQSACRNSRPSTCGLPIEETKENALLKSQEEGTLIMEHLGFTRVDKNHMEEEYSPSCSREEEPCLTSLNRVSKKDVNDYFEDTECCSCTTPSSIHYNSIAQLESLEQIMNHRVSEISMKQDHSGLCSTPKTLLPIYNSCTRLSEGHPAWLSTDAVDGMPLESKNEIYSGSVWRVRDNPIATDDSELDSPRPTIFNSCMILYCDDGDDDEDLVPRHHHDDLDIVKGHLHNDGVLLRNGRNYVGESENGSLSRAHRRDSDDGVQLRDEGAADHNVDDAAYGSTKTVLAEYHRDNHTRDEGSDMLVVRKMHQEHQNTDDIVCKELVPDTSYMACRNHSTDKDNGSCIDVTSRDHSSEKNDEVSLKEYIADPLITKVPRCKEHQNVCHACVKGVCHTAGGGDDINPLDREHHKYCCLTKLALDETPNYPLPNEQQQVNEACILPIQEDYDVNQAFISRENQQISNDTNLLLCSDGSGGAGHNFSEISVLMEAHLRDHPQPNEAGFERPNDADRNGSAAAREHDARENSTHRQKKEALTPAIAMEDLQACSLVETSCDEVDHGGDYAEDGGNSVVTWFSRFYVVKKWKVLFTPCGVFILTLAIVAFNTLSTKQDTTKLLVPT